MSEPENILLKLMRDIRSEIGDIHQQTSADGAFGYEKRCCRR